MINNDYSNRMFQSPDDIITGKSVVFECSQNDTDFPDNLLANSWPFGLSDYLQNFVNKTVKVKYMGTGEKPCEKQGVLIVVGSDFIGIQPYDKQDLFIIESGLIRSINIINYKKENTFRRY